MRSSSLSARTMVVTALLALLVAGVFAVLVHAVLTLRTATRDEARAKDVTAASLGVEKLVVDLESGLRGYVLTGNERFLQPWRKAREELPARLRQFKRLPADNRMQEGRARELVRLIQAYVSEYSEPLVAIAHENRALAAGSVAVGEGKRRTDEIRSRFADFIASENSLAAASATSANSRSNGAIELAIAGLLASAAFIGIFGLYLARAVAGPVREVAAGASRLAGGELSLRLRERGGPAEVAELRRSFNAMAADLERQRRELEAQNEELRRSERVKSELVNIVSHEVRTPLSSVLGFAAVLLKRDVAPEEQRRFLEIIDAQGKRLAALLDDFLDVQQIEEGRLVLSQDLIDMADLLREQIRLFTAQSDRHRLELTLADGPLEVRGDRNRLAQVVGNLLSNAIKYSPGGGRVEIVGERQDGAIRVTVRDDGRGIPEEAHDRIFTKFFRGDAAESGIQGTGLGLATSRAVVEAHGGRIDFESAPGRGSTFWLELPTASSGS